MTLFQAVILAIVEGFTEYLPISSTGHLIITSSVMGIAHESFTKDFTVIVQFGAILSVLVLYWRRFVTNRMIYLKLFVAFLPAAILGFLVKKRIDALLDSAFVVSIMLILGGLVLLFIDRWFEAQEKRLKETKTGTIEQLDLRRSLTIGLIQCSAFLPGVSRSAATIFGGLAMKLTRESAAEFSFLLAVPTLTAATAYKLTRIAGTLDSGHVHLILIGNVISFVVGAITIKTFLSYLTLRGFFLFGVYRIALGSYILFLLLRGHGLQTL